MVDGPAAPEQSGRIPTPTPPEAENMPTPSLETPQGISPTPSAQPAREGLEAAYPPDRYDLTPKATPPGTPDQLSYRPIPLLSPEDVDAARARTIEETARKWTKHLGATQTAGENKWKAISALNLSGDPTDQNLQTPENSEQGRIGELRSLVHVIYGDVHTNDLEMRKLSELLGGKDPTEIIGEQVAEIAGLNDEQRELIEYIFLDRPLRNQGWFEPGKGQTPPVAPAKPKES